jgi:hypothetical protein
MSKFELKKFSIVEMTSNNSGKTSALSTLGSFLCFIAGICFLIGSVAVLISKDSGDVLVQSLALAGIGASMLGYKKSQEKHYKEEDSTSKEVNDVP